MAGEIAEAAEVMRRLVASSPTARRNELVLAAILELSGDSVRARQVVEALAADFPGLSIATMRPTAFGSPEVAEQFVQALVKAGLPGH